MLYEDSHSNSNEDSHSVTFSTQNSFNCIIANMLCAVIMRTALLYNKNLTLTVL